MIRGVPDLGRGGHNYAAQEETTNKIALRICPNAGIFLVGWVRSAIPPAETNDPVTHHFHDHHGSYPGDVKGLLKTICNLFPSQRYPCGMTGAGKPHLLGRGASN